MARVALGLVRLVPLQAIVGAALDLAHTGHTIAVVYARDALVIVLGLTVVLQGVEEVQGVGAHSVALVVGQLEITKTALHGAVLLIALIVSAGIEHFTRALLGT